MSASQRAAPDLCQATARLLTQNIKHGFQTIKRNLISFRLFSRRVGIKIQVACNLVIFLSIKRNQFRRGRSLPRGIAFGTIILEVNAIKFLLKYCRSEDLLLTHQRTFPAIQ
ncbi:hypothetical protein LH23_23475 [Cedecea neteri]|uniref:Uncharacterized protein n=1 Tax=Cedecea neteri TaxID=158822 RepID=A0AAN0S8H7_9ENTR|nr:hypothetical protein LH23_23475 [Cedecea neteri]